MLTIPTTIVTESKHNVYNLPGEEVYDLGLLVPYNNRYIGSSHGWLIFMDIVSFIVILFNPFYFGNMKGTVPFPRFLPGRDFCQSEIYYDVFAEYYIRKAILSADPSSSTNYTVMLIYGEFSCLAYFRSQDESWTCINGGILPFCDLNYSNGRFIAVNTSGGVFSVNLEADIPQLESISESLHYNPGLEIHRRYIVVSNDKNTLLLVVRSVLLYSGDNGDQFCRTLGFSVCTLGGVVESFNWLKLSSIGALVSGR